MSFLMSYLYLKVLYIVSLYDGYSYGGFIVIKIEYDRYTGVFIECMVMSSGRRTVILLFGLILLWAAIQGTVSIDLDNMCL